MKTLFHRLVLTIPYYKKRPRWPSGKVAALGSEDSRVPSGKLTGRGNPVVVFRLRAHSVSSSNSDSTEDPPCMWAGVALKLGVGVPTHTSPSSSDRGAKIPDPSKNSSRVASKLDVHVTKLGND
ncbi:hypothetical protein AVEN_83778-1 [Araneus ventricosus]|uniref:Uncharacterized protein n=1 Tax=Araneus ventricosus TaxID=182803 RepID=A0A4Y2F932_ARAVE|nr:hypothetical protein AVEN_249352-1 [Araneus ventricosus]GBM37993.1 hypothetical protein AVEN_83778-1 [Araneus ventricosus]